MLENGPLRAFNAEVRAKASSLARTLETPTSVALRNRIAGLGIRGMPVPEVEGGRD
jgi:hypothetical protein